MQVLAVYLIFCIDASTGIDIESLRGTKQKETLETSNKLVEFESFFERSMEGMEYELLSDSSFGSKCVAGYEVSKSVCKEAALSLGAHQDQDGEIEEIEDIGPEYLAMTPPGCFIDRQRHIFFSSAVGANDGNYQSVCKVMEYELLSAIKYSKCDAGYEVSKSACKEAAQSLGANQDQHTQIEGAWSWTPSGCFQNAGEGGNIHFSTGSGTNDGRYQSICKKTKIKPPAGEYELLPAGSKCEAGYHVSASACKEAAQSLGANQDQDTQREGAWSWTPSGCFQTAGEGGHIYFSTAAGSGLNDGSYQSVCRVVEYELLSAFKGSKCHAAYEVSKSACKKAAQSLGANQDQLTQIEGAWSHTPPGCFQNAGQGGNIFFSTGRGKNNGGYQSICKKHKFLHPTGPYELLSAFKGSKCHAGYEIGISECKEAAQSLGANQDQDILLEGTWSHTPPGCFQNAGQGGNIYFSTGRGKNNGGYQSICKKTKFLRPTGPYELLSAFKDSRCRAGYEISISECKEAAQSLGANQDQDILLEGTWSHTPPGCFQNAGQGGNIHFSTGRGRNNGRYQSICKKHEFLRPTGPYELLSAFKGSKCRAGYEIGISECLEAAQSLGAKQDQDILLEGTWSWTPPGCFQTAGEGGNIHFNTWYGNKWVGLGTNDGRFQSICNKNRKIITPGCRRC